MDKLRLYILILVVILVCSVSIILLKDKPNHNDEYAHYSQIVSFIDGNYSLISYLTTIPGYHFIVAMIAKLLNFRSLFQIRLINLFLGILSVTAFYLISKKISKKNAEIKTMQFFFFPLIFIFFFTVYTDIASLLFVLAAFYALIKNKPNLAAIIMIFGMTVRQNNIFWLFFFFCYIYVEKFGYSFNMKNFIYHIKHTSVYLAGFALTILFIVINKGGVLGARSFHPLGIYFSNIFFMLFLFFFLFLPFNLANFGKIVDYVKKRKRILTVLAGLFLFYLVMFRVNHPYNFIPGFVRNEILMFFTSTVLLKALFFLPIAYSILSLCVTKLEKKSFYLLYPATLLFLMVSWLIEQRYYIIPFTFFLLFKSKNPTKQEIITLFIYVVLSALSLYMVLTTNIFL